MSRGVTSTIGRRKVVVAGASGVLLALASLGLLVLAVEPSEEGAPERLRPEELAVAWHDALREELGGRWRIYSDGKGASTTVAARAGQGLILALDTRDCERSAVCTVGVVVREPLEVGDKLDVGVLLDWNASGNSSYRAAGLLLSTSAPQDGQALEDLEDALWFELVGVPPGLNARRFGASRKGRWVRPMVTDGWPQKREGQPFGQVRLELGLTPEGVVFLADGEVVSRGKHPFPRGKPLWLILYTKSHANFPARPVTFQEVWVSGVAKQGRDAS